MLRGCQGSGAGFLVVEGVQAPRAAPETACCHPVGQHIRDTWLSEGEYGSGLALVAEAKCELGHNCDRGLSRAQRSVRNSLGAHKWLRVHNVQVKEASQTATLDCFKVNGNRDIEQFIPHLVSCIANPAQTTDTIHKLAATTFVQQVCLDSVCTVLRFYPCCATLLGGVFLPPPNLSPLSQDGTLSHCPEQLLLHEVNLLLLPASTIRLRPHLWPSLCPCWCVACVSAPPLSSASPASSLTTCPSW